MIDEREYDYKVTAAGRINIIGEHVDYCGGKVLPAALSLCNTVYVRANGKKQINLGWTTLPDKVTLDTERLEDYRNLRFGNYQAGSALMWKMSGREVVGCDMVQDCTVPFGSGLSSSAAIEVSTIAALAAVSGQSIDRVSVALLAQRAEREYAGVNCGIMDQYASACGRKGCAMLLDCKTLGCEYIPVDLGDCALIIANSNKPHNLVESKYNERRAETEEALSIIGEHMPISCLADLTPEQFYGVERYLGGKVRMRARHVVEECERVRLAAAAVKGEICPPSEGFLNDSHESLKTLYEVTGTELDALAEAAQAHPACLGSRMTGAGFGGCTISIVEKSGAEDFKSAVGRIYYEKTGYRASFYDAEIADGITVTKLR